MLQLSINNRTSDSISDLRLLDFWPLHGRAVWPRPPRKAKSKWLINQFVQSHLIPCGALSQSALPGVRSIEASRSFVYPLFLFIHRVGHRPLSDLFYDSFLITFKPSTFRRLTLTILPTLSALTPLHSFQAITTSSLHEMFLKNHTAFRSKNLSWPIRVT